MADAVQMKMVNGRVSAQSADKAAKVLGREGLTVSAFIRNSLEHVARTGEVPECGRPESRGAIDRKRLGELVKALERKPMPGKRAYADVGEDELVERLRMERYGY